MSSRWCWRRREGRRWCRRRRGRGCRHVVDGQHRWTGALSSVEPFRCWAGGLIAQHQPAEIAGWVVQPRLHVDNHLRRTPHILSNEANQLACTHRGGKVAALRRPKNGVVETVPPRGIVRGSRRSAAFLSRGVRGSFSPIGQQLMQFDGSRSIGRDSGAIQTEGHAYDRRAGPNASRDVEGEHASAEFTHGVLTGKEVKTNAIAVVALSRIVLVERIIFAGNDADSRRVDRTCGSTAKRSREYKCE